MTSEPAPAFVAAAATMAAAAGAAGTGGAAQAQAAPNVRHQNPPGMSKPPTYSHVVEVSGPHRTVYLAGPLADSGPCGESRWAPRSVWRRIDRSASLWAVRSVVEPCSRFHRGSSHDTCRNVAGAE